MSVSLTGFNSALSNTSTTTFSVSRTGIAAGSCVAVVVSYDCPNAGGDSDVVTDDLSATATRVTLSGIRNQNWSQYTVIHYFANYGGGSRTFTCTLSTARGAKRIAVYELAGADTSSPQEGIAASYTSSFTSTPSSGNVSPTPTVNGEFLVAILTSGGTPPLTPSSPWTADGTYDGNSASMLAHYAQATAAAISSDWTTASGAPASVSVASFKPAAGGPITPTGFSVGASLGSVVPATTVLPVGQSISASLGTPTASNQTSTTVTPTGFSLASSLGTFGTEADITMMPAGGSLTMSLGTPTTTGTSGNVNIVPTGYAPAFSLGTPVVEVDEVFPVTGFAPAFSLGTPTVVFPDLTVLPTGFVVQVLSNAVKVTGPSSGGPHFVRATSSHGHKSRIILPTDTDIA